MSLIFVTGANGFIGKRLCLSLSSLDRKLRKNVRKIIPGDPCEQYICTFGADQITSDALEDVETVFHLVGVTHDIQNTSKLEQMYYAINVDATLQLANLAVIKGVKRFIYVSSVKAGGAPIEGECMTEESQVEPEGVYGKTKREAELKLLEIGKKSEMNVTIIRPSLVYGVGVKGNLLKMLSSISKGWFPPLPEVTNRQSMIHVDDLVDLLMLVEKNERSYNEIFIATDGLDYSSREVFMAMSRAMSRKVPSWSIPVSLFVIAARMGDVINKFVPFPFDSYRYNKLLGDKCFSSKKAQSLLFFKPHRTLYSTLPDIVKAL